MYGHLLRNNLIRNLTIRILREISQSRSPRKRPTSKMANAVSIESLSQLRQRVQGGESLFSIGSDEEGLDGVLERQAQEVCRSL